MSSKEYFSLSHDDHEAIDIISCHKPHQNIAEIHRIIGNKNAKQNLKERPRTLHRFTVSGILLNELGIKRDFHKIIAHIRQLKDLRRLNIDLVWLKECSRRKHIEKFAKSLRHLKSLSTLYFYINTFSQHRFDRSLRSLPQHLGKILDLSKIEVQLSLMISSRETLYNIEDFFKLGLFNSVHITLLGIDLASLSELLAVLKKSKSLSKFSITLSDCDWSCDLACQDFFRGLKEMRSMKYLRVHIDDSYSIKSSQLRKITPIVQEIAKTMNLEMIFADFDGRKGDLTRLDQWLFNRSLKKLGSFYKIRIRFVGGFLPSLSYIRLIIFLLIMYAMSFVGMIPLTVPIACLIAFGILILVDGILTCFVNLDGSDEWETGKSLLRRELQYLSSS